jgi:hypothetical protein
MINYHQASEDSWRAWLKWKDTPDTADKSVVNFVAGWNAYKAFVEQEDKFPGTVNDERKRE